MIENDELKPVDTCAYTLFCGLGILVFVSALTSNAEKVEPLLISLLYVFSVFQFGVGLGILRREKWAFKVMRFVLLYFIRPGYPLGTVFAKKMLTYIDDHDLGKYFH